MNIQEQKDISLEVLKVLREFIDNSAVIAGGAPRNWDHDMEANDIDIYLRCRAPLGILELLSILLEEVPEKGDKVDVFGYGVNPMHKIDNILNFTYKDLKFQIIVSEKNPMLVCGTFSFGLCNITAIPNLRGDGLIDNPGADYLRDKRAKVLRLRANHIDKIGLEHFDAYVDKIVEQFPEYVYVARDPVAKEAHVFDNLLIR